MSAKQILADLTAFDSILNHRTAAPGDLETSRWLIEACKSAGLTAQLREFPFARREISVARLELKGGAVIKGVPLFDAQDTHSHGIEGQLGESGSDAPIGLVRFTPQGAVPPNTMLDAVRKSTSHAALIALSAAETVVPGLALHNADHYGTPFGPPVLQVASESRSVLETAAKNRESVSLLISSRWEQARATNVDLIIQGTDPKSPAVVIYTPKSAWWTCTAERGGGLVVWLALMRYFAKNPPQATMHFTANSGHELGHLGMRRFLAEYPELALKAEFWVHLGANFATKGSRLLLQADTAERLAPLIEALKKQGITDYQTTPFGQMPLGEAKNIHEQGGCYVSMLGGNRWFHHPEDRLATSVDLERCVSIVAAYLDCIPALINT